MNYLKKIRSLGFKKTSKPLVISEKKNYDRGWKVYYASYIQDAKSWLDEVWNRVSNVINPTNGDEIRNYDMNMQISEQSIRRMHTWFLKVNESFTLYITISGNDFCCFAEDSENEGQKNFVVLNSNFDENFWKRILESLPIRNKREILLKDIL